VAEDLKRKIPKVK
jgi:hypothetical protein